ncbi:tudor domain-containing protein 6 isoform X2 [Engystomops pustulosus]|uniref:tudor domain-containing protein 6 isoform X2 n=1 Tax=Engystomops pustulosus TaxID=76066 RepID=UPI003AFB7790
MASVQPYRFPESTHATNLALNYGYPEGAPSPSLRNQFRRPNGTPVCSPNQLQQYSPVKMDYLYPQLEIGVTEPVMVTQVLDPHRLFCQLRSLSHEVQRLSESMHHYYEVQKGYGDQETALPLVLGQPCASCGSDGRWYRSLLQELFLDRQLAMVIHVDWGRRDIVPLSGLRNLTSEFLRMPVFTFPCTLCGISDGGLGWDVAVISDLRTMLLGRHVNAKIECYNSYEHLYVITLFAEDGMNLNCVFGIRSQNPKLYQVPLPALVEPSPVDTVKKIPVKPDVQIIYMSKYPPVELKIGKFEDAVVEFVIDPFSFWVRLGKYAANHKEMVDGMTKFYSQASKLMGIIKPKPGQLCCTKYEDSFHRAEVISVIDKKVNVYFLDSGVVEVVDWSEIRELPAEYTKLPALANKCSIADTFPIEDTWSEEAILAFKVAVTDKKLIIRVLSKDSDEYIVEIMDQSRIEEKFVGKILAKAGLARFEEPDAVYQSSGDKIAHVELSKTILNPNASDYVSKVQETTTSDHTSKSRETTASDKVSKLQETTASYPGDETTEVSPFEQQLFEPGTTIEVIVSHVRHPGIFWCQNADSKADLGTLMTAIQSHCKSTDCPYVGDSLACLAKSLDDELWYRAFITEVPVNFSKTSSVEVEYVDYGKRETVPVTNLRALSSEFFRLKAQAFKCSLYNIITPKGSNPFLWDKAATKVFLEFVQGASKWTEFHCTIYAIASLHGELFNIVDLYTPFSKVCDTLVKSGYATHLYHKTLAPSMQLYTYYYSMHDIKLGSEEEIYITHVDSSHMFYAQLARSSNIIDEISFTIKKIMEKTRRKKVTPLSGNLCLAKFSDQQWYRGLIQSENGCNKVFFVDYGNTEKVSEEDLLPIMPSEHDLLLVPMQAIKCFLPDIPPKVPSEIISWFEDAVLEKTLKARIVAKDADGKLSVELYDGEQQINATLKRKLRLNAPKDKSDHPAIEQPRTFRQEERRTFSDRVDNQERKTPFSVGKNFKNRDSDNRSHSDIGQEPEPRYRKNPVVQYKTDNKDYNSRFQEFSGQRKTESSQRASSNDSNHENLGRRDTKQGGNTLPQRQTSASEFRSPAKPPVVSLSDIPKRKISKGMKELVYLSHTNSVFDFHVQVAEDTRLDEISDILNKEKSSLEALADEDIREGNVICAYFSDDGLYYRGLVREKSRRGMCVEYIDYGNTSILSDCRNYRLPPKCCSIPVMAIHCSLQKPSTASNAPNLEELLGEFSKRTSDLQLSCEFLKQDGHKWDVLLQDELGCINDLLNPREEPGPEESTEEASETIMTEEEEISSVGAFTWDLPQPGETVKVYTSSAEGPECFWCQLSTADIESLASQVQKAGEESVKSDEFFDTLQVGSPCNVIFSEDNNWYRAMVTRMEGELVTVRFIDYGNEDTVGKDQIKILPESLVKIPPQALSCRLADFDTNAGTWSPEGKDYFYEKVTEDALELTVLEIQEGYSFPIPMACVTIQYNEININEEMSKFWQKVDPLRPDKSINSSYADLIEVEGKDLPTTDSRSNVSEDSSQYEECTNLPGLERPLQDDGIHYGEDQEYNTDGVEAVDVPRAHDDPDAGDVDHAPEDFGSYVESSDTAGDVFPNPTLQDPSDQGFTIDSGPSENSTFHQPRDLEATQDQEPTTESEGTEEVIIPGAETEEEYEDCTEDGAEPENGGDDVPTKDYEKIEDHLTIADDDVVYHQSDYGMEEAAFSKVIVTSEELKESTMESEAVETRRFIAHDVLDEAGETAGLRMTIEEEILGIIDGMISSVIREDGGNFENIVTGEDFAGTDRVVAILNDEEIEASMTREDIVEENLVDRKASAELLDTNPEEVLILQDKAIEEDAECYGGPDTWEDYVESEDLLTIDDIVTLPQSNDEREEAALSEVIVTSKYLNEIMNVLECEDTEIRSYTEHDDRDKAGEAAPATVTGEDETVRFVNEIIQSVIRENYHKGEDLVVEEDVEGTNAEVDVVVDEENEEAMTSEDLAGEDDAVDSKLPAELLDRNPEDALILQDKAAEEDEERYGGQDACEELTRVDYEETEDLLTQHDVLISKETPQSNDELEDAALRKVLRDDGDKKEDLMTEDDVEGTNAVVDVVVDEENVEAMTSEDLAEEDAVDSKLPAELLDSNPEDALILQDTAAKEDEERYGGQDTCEELDESEDLLITLSMIREDDDTREDKVTDVDVKGTNAVVDVVVPEESESTVTRADVIEENVVDSKVSAVLLDMSPKDVLILQEDDVEHYGALDTCQQLTSEDYERSEAVLTTHDVLKSEETPWSKLEEAALSKVIVTSEDLEAFGNFLDKEATEIRSFVASDNLDKAGEKAPTTETQEDKTREILSFVNETTPTLISFGDYEGEDIVTDEDFKRTNAVRDVVVEEESEAAMTSEDVFEEYLVDSKVSTELLVINPENVLILQDKSIEEEEERYGGLDSSEELTIEVYEENEDLLVQHDILISEETPQTNDELEDAALRKVLVTGTDLNEFGNVLDSEPSEIRSYTDPDGLDGAGDAAPTTGNQEDRTRQTDSFENEDNTSVIREDDDKREDLVTEEDVEGTNVVADVVVVAESEPALTSKEEDVVDSDVSAVLQDLNPEDVLMLQVIEEDVEGYGELVECEVVTREDDIAPGLGVEDILAMEDPPESQAESRSEEGLDSEDYLHKIHVEDFSGYEEMISYEVSTEHSGFTTSKDFMQTEEDLTSCEYGGVIDREMEEVMYEDEEVVSREEVLAEASLSYEELEATIVESPSIDLSQNFEVCAGVGPVVDLEHEDNMIYEGVEMDEELGECKTHEDHATGEDLGTGAAVFEDLFFECLSTENITDHEETEIVESSQEVADCGSDVGDLGNQPDSFIVYRECPTLIASTDSVYESEINEPLDETDSDCGGLAGGNDDLLWSFFCGTTSAVQDTAETEDADECADRTLYENPSQTDCAAEAADLGDTQCQGAASDTDDLLWRDFYESLQDNPEPEDVDDECGDFALHENPSQTDDFETEATDVGDTQCHAPDTEGDVSSSWHTERSPSEESGPRGEETTPEP